MSSQHLEVPVPRYRVHPASYNDTAIYIASYSRTVLNFKGTGDMISYHEEDLSVVRGSVQQSKVA